MYVKGLLPWRVAFCQFVSLCAIATGTFTLRA